MMVFGRRVIVVSKVSMFVRKKFKKRLIFYKSISCVGILVKNVKTFSKPFIRGRHPEFTEYPLEYSHVEM